MGKLLAVGTTNAKTAKNSRATAIMYLLPHKQNSKGINLCPKAGSCADFCLSESGRVQMFNSIRIARMNRTERFVNDKKQFCLDLMKELNAFRRKVDKLQVESAVRLNGTSDIDWIGIMKRQIGVDLLSEFPEFNFYDYTKIIGKVKKYTDTNYRHTFSYSEDKDSMNDSRTALSLDTPVSVVFSTKKGDDLPLEFLGNEVIDGDKADDIMLDKSGGYILGLRYKPQARKKADREKELADAIKSGFVIEV